MLIYLFIFFKVLYNKFTGAAKCYGFCTFKTTQAAQIAIATREILIKNQKANMLQYQKQAPRPFYPRTGGAYV